MRRAAAFALGAALGAALACGDAPTAPDTPVTFPGFDISI